MSGEASRIAHAVGLGVRRGWLEFVQSVRSTQDQWFYVFTALLTLGYLWIRRDSESGVDGIPFAAVALPSLLAALLVFGMVIGPAGRRRRGRAHWTRRPDGPAVGAGLARGPGRNR